MTKYCGGAKIYLKREDLNHTGAHKINNTIGQALLAVRMGKKKLSLKQELGNTGGNSYCMCSTRIRMRHLYGRRRCETSKLNVFRMELLGAKVESVAAGSGTLKDAVNEALRYWVSHVHDTHYIMGSVLGPHPFPQIVRDFQSVIGNETKNNMRR